MVYLFISLAVLVILVFFSYYLHLKVVRPPRMIFENVIDNEVEKGNISLKWYESLKKEKGTMVSTKGHEIYYEFFENEVKTKKTIIIVHGHGCSVVGSLKYLTLFYKMGFNVLAYDHVNSGKSGGKYTTMGHIEKIDLLKMTNIIREKYGKDAFVGLHGESMGAATSLMYLELDNNIQFVISDCSYSDLTSELKYHLKRKFGLPKFPFIFIASFLSRIINGFYYSQISPLNCVGSDFSYKVPVLFIHGEKDDYTPCLMSEELYQNKIGYKELYIVKEAEHARSYESDKKEYEKRILIFLSNIGDI